MIDEDEQRQLASVCADLVREFAGGLSAEAVEHRFQELVAEFEGAPVRTFVPVLVQRRVREDLRAHRRVVQLPE